MSPKSTFQLISVRVKILKINVNFSTYCRKIRFTNSCSINTQHLHFICKKEDLYCSRYTHFVDRSNTPWDLTTSNAEPKENCNWIPWKRNWNSLIKLHISVKQNNILLFYFNLSATNVFVRPSSDHFYKINVNTLHVVHIIFNFVLDHINITLLLKFRCKNVIIEWLYCCDILRVVMESWNENKFNIFT